MGYKYFLYSSQQHKDRESVEKNVGRVYTAGKVLINGKWKDYTEISSSSKNAYSDSKIVAEGELSNIKYKKSTSTVGRNN